MGGTVGLSDPILTRIVEEDKVKWFKKPNLRLMYVCLFLCCMGVEMTSGFDSTLIGTLQFSDPWNACKLSRRKWRVASLNKARLWEKESSDANRKACSERRNAWIRLFLLPAWFHYWRSYCAVVQSKVWPTLVYHGRVFSYGCWIFHTRFRSGS
jgi:hypothetical protein